MLNWHSRAGRVLLAIFGELVVDLSMVGMRVLHHPEDRFLLPGNHYRTSLPTGAKVITSPP
jgi:hypothetical protein